MSDNDIMQQLKDKAEAFNESLRVAAEHGITVDVKAYHFGNPDIGPVDYCRVRFKAVRELPVPE